MQRWPRRLWIVRHGESTGNVARQAAMDAGLSEINIDHRDIDVPLSVRGEQQAMALGRWFKSGDAGAVPGVVVASPYARARRTAELIAAHGGFADAEMSFDERLREKEFGVLDRLTAAGILERYPEQARFRSLLGKFYHRPPAGESWCDVILRLRSLLDTVGLHHAGEDVLIVSHQVVVLCLRYIIESLTEEEILAIDRQGDVANCSVTEYRLDPDAGRGGQLVLERYNFVAPLREEGATVTVEPPVVSSPQ
ncbi:MAG TPA: histidine phosphatase family protein [Devosia sp.]|uniref:histidine phosphatase family protein n=1 Tax=Devosia sp. TaxID=1871048 RepID=UPI002F92D4B9